MASRACCQEPGELSLPVPWYFWLGQDAHRYLEEVLIADGWSVAWRISDADLARLTESSHEE